MKCAYDETVKDIAFDEELRASYKRSNAILLTVWIIGVLLFIPGVIVIAVTNNMIGLMLLLAGVCISGVPTAIQYWKKGAEAHREYEDRFGETYHVSGNGVYKEQAGVSDLDLRFWDCFSA